MLSKWIRTWYSPWLTPSLHFIAKLGINANALTIASLIVVISAGILFAFGKTTLGAWILLFGGFLDGLDGALARLIGRKSKFGAFLDSICDHCGDFAIYFGLLLLYLQRDAITEVILIFVALFASVFGSHVRSRAGMIGVDLKTVGIFTRAERILVIMIGLLIDKTTIALWALAIFNSFSALQRVIYMIWFSEQNENIVTTQET